MTFTAHNITGNVDKKALIRATYCNLYEKLYGIKQLNLFKVTLTKSPNHGHDKPRYNQLELARKNMIYRNVTIEKYLSKTGTKIPNIHLTIVLRLDVLLTKK